MPLGEPKFENPPVPFPEKPGLERPLTFAEKERSLNDLREFFKDSSSEMREDGIPVDDRGRINIDKFKGVYSPSALEADKEYVKEHKEIFQRAKISEIESRGFLPGLKEKAIQEMKFGEACEMLTTAILQRNLKENFIALRSSEYDDIKNGADTIILDKKTGNVICALDEIADTKSKRFEEKQKNTLMRNLQGGGFLKYGLSLNEGKQEGGGKTELKKGAMHDIPLFYCGFSKNQIEAALRGFRPSEESSAAEIKLFNDFLDSTRGQLDDLKKERLDPKLRERLELFERSVLK